MTFPAHCPDIGSLHQLGIALSKNLTPNSVIALDGDLGAGKTTLTQGIMKGLDYTGEVTSPTFSLVQEYHGGRLPTYHFDFYRIESPQELDHLGWDDYLERDALVIVEWASLYPDFLPPHTLSLHLQIQDPGRLVSRK